MCDLQFPTPMANDYQWRNLYLRQYGLCTYAPPMPKHPEATAPNALNPSSRHKRHVEGDIIGKAGDVASLIDITIGDDQESLFGVFRKNSLLPPINDMSHAGSLRYPSVDILPAPQGTDHSETLSDKQLFSSDMFSFLSRHNSESPSLPLMQSQRTFPYAKQFDSSSIMCSSTQANIEQVDSNSKKTTSKDPPSELLRLQRETWHLLMDNRIMSWFEREAKERGRIAANVKQRLLEVVSCAPETRSKVAFVSPTDENSKRKNSIDEETENDIPPSSRPPTPGTEEDEKLMETLDQFSSFFAVISPPEAIQRLVGPALAAQERGWKHATSDIIGLPLFSQYATWRETYENRKVWALAPFSFFLIHDCSYNYAHISALYVLLDQINSTAHNHTIDCAMNEQKRQLTTDLQQRRSLGSRNGSVEPPLCPLMVTQELTEDLLLAYEQSSAQTTLSMALRVQEFLTDIVLDRETASSFLSPEALRNQCGVDKGSSDENTTEKGAKNETPNKNVDSNGADGAKAEQEEVSKEEIGSLPVEEGEIFDWTSLKNLNDSTFDDLFTLAYWFVDAPTANSLIPLETQLATPSPNLLKKGFTISGTNLPSSPMMDSKRSKTRNVITETDTACGREPSYIIGRVREYDATMSIVEAITRYEVQRQQSTEPKTHGLQERAPTVMSLKKQRKKRLTNAPVSLQNEPVSIIDPSAEVTLLSAPLTFILTYIRLHGAPWLKELLGRLFNILRRESVLLYVNGLDIDPVSVTPQLRSYSQTNTSFDRSTEGVFASGRDSGRWQHTSLKETTHQQRLERLEDLICQDIQYVMDEFFSALHGKRSLTRLPQGISVLLTNFCTTIHLHLLQRHVNINAIGDDPVVSVRRCLNEMRQKRVTGGSAHTTEGQKRKNPTDRLIRSIENSRLARFILFDCWILPTLNNAVEFGYLPEGTANHLRWNVDAFARYLKILVHSPFVSADTPDAFLHNISAPTAMSQRGAASPSIEKKFRTHYDGLSAPRCDTMKLPPFINGIYDIVSGSLMQLFTGHGDTEVEYSEERFSLGNTQTISDISQFKKCETSFGSLELRRPWRDLSRALSSLNESLGLTGGDTEEEEIYEDNNDATPARILNIFCTRASNDISSKVVVTEYEIMPSTAGGCISKTFSLVSGQHPIVRNAYLSGALVGQFKSSPYLTCLTGVLLHPRTVSAILENIYQNSFAFYNALIRPLQDESLLSLISPLVVSRKNLPLVDSNGLLPLIAAVPMKLEETFANSETNATSYHVYNRADPPHHKKSQMAIWEATTRRLLKKRSQLTTGAALDPELTLHPLLRSTGPTNSFKTLSKTADIITKEMQRVPLCFDTWWRAMVVALTVKAMNIIEECGDVRSMQWKKKCHTKLQEVQREYRGLSEYFIENKGGRLDISTAKAMSFAKDKKRKANSVNLSQTKSAGSKITEQTKQQKKKRKQGTLKGEKKAK